MSGEQICYRGRMAGIIGMGGNEEGREGRVSCEGWGRGEGDGGKDVWKDVWRDIDNIYRMNRLSWLFESAEEDRRRVWAWSEVLQIDNCSCLAFLKLVNLGSRPWSTSRFGSAHKRGCMFVAVGKQKNKIQPPHFPFPARTNMASTPTPMRKVPGRRGWVKRIRVQLESSSRLDSTWLGYSASC